MWTMLIGLLWNQLILNCFILNVWLHLPHFDLWHIVFLKVLFLVFDFKSISQSLRHWWSIINIVFWLLLVIRFQLLDHSFQITWFIHSQHRVYRFAIWVSVHIKNEVWTFIFLFVLKLLDLLTNIFHLLQRFLTLIIAHDWILLLCNNLRPHSFRSTYAILTIQHILFLHKIMIISLLHLVLTSIPMINKSIKRVIRLYSTTIIAKIVLFIFRWHGQYCIIVFILINASQSV